MTDYKQHGDALVSTVVSQQAEVCLCGACTLFLLPVRDFSIYSGFIPQFKDRPVRVTAGFKWATSVMH